jgi:hypothetical protein
MRGMILRLLDQQVTNSAGQLADGDVTLAILKTASA